MSDKPKVVSLRGGHVPVAQKAVDPGFVEDVRQLLQKAEDGEIKGMCCVYLDNDDSVGFLISGHTVSYRTLGALHMMMRHIECSLIEEEEELGIG